MSSFYRSDQHRLSTLEQKHGRRRYASRGAAGSERPAASHPVEVVDVSAGVQQVLNDLRVALLGGDGERRVAVLIGQVDVGIPLQQLFDDVRVAAFHRHDQSRPGVLGKQKN